MMRPLARFVTFNRVLWVLAGGIMLNVVYIVYLATYPARTIEYKNSPFPIVNGLTQEQIHSDDQALVQKTKTIAAGDVLAFQIDLCRYTKVPTQFTQTLSGPTTITMVSNAFATSETGCRKIISRSAVIPSYAPSGTYHLDITTCWQVTALKNVCQQIKTKDFQVIAKE